METADLVGTLRAEGELLARAADSAGPDAAVPTCPGWAVRDLVAHVGGVHRWAAGYVAGSTRPRPRRPVAPADEELVGWFRDGHRALADALAAAPEDLECWTFLPAPSPLAFWARRQAHETTVHRVDAESALGTPPGSAASAPVAPEFALDGIDELLRGFHTRNRSKVRSATPRTVLLRPTDDALAGRGRLLRLSAGPLVTEDVAAGDAVDADCTLHGPAEALYLTLWNRPPPADRIRLTGDARVMEAWRETSAIG